MVKINNVILNKGQNHIVSESIPFFNSNSKQVMEIDGGPGTGKSTLLQYIIQLNRIPLSKILPVAYTGAASIVMKLNGFPHAKTIHSGFYDCIEDFRRDAQGRIIYDNFHNRPKMDIAFVPKDLSNIELIIIDEAGNVPLKMKKDLLKHGIKIIAVGDLGQLPPIDDEPAFLTGPDVYHLNEIMRQKANSNILYLAYRAKYGLPIQYGYYGDCMVIDEDDLNDEMILRSDLVICGTNKKRDEINKRVRNKLGFKTDLPCRGERVICRKNNYRTEIDGINLANGLIGTVLNNPGIDGFDGKTFMIDFQPMLFNNVFTRLRCDYNYLMADHKEKERIKKSKYSEGDKFEFSYAITAHLSQGQTLNNAIYIQEYLSPEINNRLDNVAITRCKHGLIFVKRKQKIWRMGY